MLHANRKRWYQVVCELFMWMLHIKTKSDDDVFIKLENGLCKCYIKSKSDDDDIYQVVELFVWT
jgi:hypothetical protein